MKCNCEGCECEWDIACFEVRWGNHLATIEENPYTFPDNGEHFMMLIVDDNGKWLMG